MCNLRFEGRDTPEMEVVGERSNMLLSKEMLEFAGRVFVEKRVSCVFRDLNWTKLDEPHLICLIGSS